MQPSLIRQGQIELLDPDLVDFPGAGDFLGLGRFLGHTNHRHSARTASDVILLALDAATLDQLVQKYPQASSYLSAAARPHALGRDIRVCALTIMVRLSRPQMRPSAAFLEYKSSDQGVTNVVPGLL